MKRAVSFAVAVAVGIMSVFLSALEPLHLTLAAADETDSLVKLVIHTRDFYEPFNYVPDPIPDLILKGGDNDGHAIFFSSEGNGAEGSSEGSYSRVTLQNGDTEVYLPEGSYTISPEYSNDIQTDLCDISFYVAGGRAVLDRSYDSYSSLLGTSGGTYDLYAYQYVWTKDTAAATSTTSAAQITTTTTTTTPVIPNNVLSVTPSRVTVAVGETVEAYIVWENPPQSIGSGGMALNYASVMLNSDRTKAYITGVKVGSGEWCIRDNGDEGAVWIEVVEAAATTTAVTSTMTVPATEVQRTTTTADSALPYILPESMKLKVGDTGKLLVVNQPSGSAVDWTCSDTSVAEIEDGTVKAVGAGTAQIYALCGGTVLTCSITVVGAESAARKSGDVNGDGVINVADAVAILQYIANAEKYPLSGEAYDAADVYRRGDGVTGLDAVAIQKYDAKVIDTLPESYE